VIAEQSDTLSKSTIITYKYAGIPRGVFLADDNVLREIESALESVERSSDEMAFFLLRLTFAIALIYHGADRSRGYDLMRSLRETSIDERFAMNMLPVTEIYLAREQAEQGEEDLAIQRWRALAEDMDRAGHYNNIDLPFIYTAQQLISRGKYDEAAGEIDRLMSLAADHKWASREIAALQLRARLAEARSDDATYRELRDQYRAMANDLGFEGHMAWAAEMP
jgi:adenylate cyclase